MNCTGFSRFLSILLVLAIFVPVFIGAGAASGLIYVNNDQSTLDGDLSDAYAIGSGGNIGLVTGDDAYAMTGSGLEQISGGGAPSGGGAVEITGNVAIETTTVKVGLYYSSSALSSVDVQNSVGSGFQFGYYDSSRNFHAVGSTGETALTVVRDINVTVSAGTIGCYHILLPGSYSSFEEAQRAASAYSDGFPAYYSGSYYALVGAYESQSAAESAIASRGISGEAYSASNRCVVVTKTGTTDILFEFDYGTTASLALRPISGSEKAITYLRGSRYYGDFEFFRYNGGDMHVINVLDIEDYVKGVLPYEMSASWPIEALKAQACSARTYMAMGIGRRSSLGFDLYNTASDQVYRGLGSASANSDAAVDATAGLYITYNGALAQTYYFAADGGATENSENVWSAAVPYLRGVIDPYEADIEFYCKSWSKTLTTAQVSSLFSGYGLGTVSSISLTYTDVGNVRAVTVQDTSGRSYTFSNTSSYGVTRFLSALGFTYTSYHFDVTYDAASDSYTIAGGGSGHNVGMSQWGAYSMALVHGKNYREILGFYFNGVSLSTGVVS